MDAQLDNAGAVFVTWAPICRMRLWPCLQVLQERCVRESSYPVRLDWPDSFVSKTQLVPGFTILP